MPRNTALDRTVQGFSPWYTTCHELGTSKETPPQATRRVLGAPPPSRPGRTVARICSNSSAPALSATCSSSPPCWVGSTACHTDQSGGILPCWAASRGGTWRTRASRPLAVRRVAWGSFASGRLRSSATGYLAGWHMKSTGCTQSSECGGLVRSSTTASGPSAPGQPFQIQTRHLAGTETTSPFWATCVVAGAGRGGRAGSGRGGAASRTTSAAATPARARATPRRRARRRQRPARSVAAGSRGVDAAAAASPRRRRRRSRSVPGILGHLLVQQRRQPASALDQAALDRARGRAELLGDLLDRQVGQVVQQQDLAVLARQLGERLDQGAVLRVQRDDRGRRAEPGEHGGLPAGAPEPIDGQAHRDPA